MSSGIYSRMLDDPESKLIDLLEGSIRCCLMSHDHWFYSKNKTWDNISHKEVTGFGYTQGGIVLTPSIDYTDERIVFGAADIRWPFSIITAHHAVLWDSSTCCDNLICSFDFGKPEITLNYGTFNIKWNKQGIISIDTEVLT